jgi:hypothetical protein
VTLNREEYLFADALAQAPTQRGAFLAQACGDNLDLLAHLVALLAAHEGSESPMVPAALSRPAITSEEKPGDVIGRSFHPTRRAGAPAPPARPSTLRDEPLSDKFHRSDSVAAQRAGRQRGRRERLDGRRPFYNWIPIAGAEPAMRVSPCLLPARSEALGPRSHNPVGFSP